MKFTAYFDGSLEIEADSVEEAWDKFDEIVKSMKLDLNNYDVIQDDKI